MPKPSEIEKEEKIDYSFDVVNKAQKLRSTTLLKQSEEIKKTLSDKNASMQDLNMQKMKIFAKHYQMYIH